MELRVSSTKPGLSPSDCLSDPEEKEVSEGEDEDDDRNHKHRKKETRSQSLERDAPDQVFTRPYRKRNKHFENGYSYGGGDSQSGGTLSARFEKRRPNPTAFSGIDLKYRNRGNQSMSGEAGPGRGRGREPSSWGLRDSRLGSSDIAPQLVQPGSAHSSLFSGRGLTNVSNAQSTSWNAFGLVPGISNGALDTLHPLGFQSSLRPSISPAMNIVIPRQRCRDFEERGFCLRGDMCPMEHGVNRIIVEDVQSLSQFNLPVSLPGSQLLGTPAGHGTFPAVNVPAPSVTLMNGRALHGKSSKIAMTDDGLGLNGGFVGGSMTGGPDVYDPDQPLWTNDRAETSAALLALNPSNVDETESFLDMDASVLQQIKFSEGFDDEHATRNASTAVSQNPSVWGRIDSSQNRSGLKEKINSSVTSSTNLETNSKDLEALNPGLQDASDHGKWMNVNQNGPQFKEMTFKQQSETGHDVRKPSHKALRTLFVKGIPSKDNRKEALLSHFRKFGRVIDIYIPLNGERAFVQFSNREEAEAALKAPDAVMGNRFIKLWWANRDNIPDDGVSGSSNVPITPRGVTPSPSFLHPSSPDKGKENSQSAGGKDSNTHPSVAQAPVYDHPKPTVSSSPKAPPHLRNKLESLELLKEEVRKKQLMLDQKRNDFRLRLTKLEKHATGLKDLTSDPASKRLKGDTLADPVEAETSGSTPRDNMVAEKSAEHATPSNSTALQESPSSRPLIRPLAPLGARAPFMLNRFKLDNRPTSFKVVSPLPDGLANVAALEEHFSSYGDLSSVELEELEPQETSNASLPSNVAARVSFTTRHSAEKAFLNGKCWQGHNLRFMWITYSNSSKNSGGTANSSAPSDRPSYSNVQSSGEAVSSSGSSKNIGDSGYCAAASNERSDANVQSSGEGVSTLEKTSALGSDKSENPTNGSNVVFVNQDMDSKSSSTTISGEEQLI
ncbi:zinc finger CCCH domain-containing 41-like [Olea europaea subsp. europaea]|uniref:Zinc finger CCCH domain-containing 41-like n=1 Tax=Olea europaea subsp. europaea TaxID=158383 RepID=A0A8S0TA43_OLEEU|nr:zinc finger CCCH domain-containing 41-like [Olea europaea subsp. europaea]